jgi:hypothetical protein
MAAYYSKILLNFLHDCLKDENRLIVDFLIEKRWFYQVVTLWAGSQPRRLDRFKKGKSVLIIFGIQVFFGRIPGFLENA